ATEGNTRARSSVLSGSSGVRFTWCKGKSPALQLEQFAEALGLLAGDRDFGLLFVVHFEHVAGLEPGHDLLDVMNVYKVGAVRAPENVGVKCGVHLFERAVVGSAISFARADCDEAVGDGGEDEVFRANEQHALLGFNEQLDRGGGGGGPW